MEGLRGIAAVSVLLGHVNVHLASGVAFGPVGVLIGVMGHGLTLFFALSGFLLFRPFASGLLTGRRFPDLKRFFANRLLRIFPAYLVIFAVVSFMFGAAYTQPGQPGAGVEGTSESIGYLWNPALIVPNLLMVQTLFPFSLKTGLGVAWSLTVEFIFYLVLPTLALVAWRLRTGRNRRAPGGLAFALLPPIAILAIGSVGKIIMSLTFHPASPADEFYLEWGGNWYAVFARSFLVHADLFAFGMFAALIFAAYEAGRIPQRVVAPIRWAGLGIGAVLVLCSRFFGEWNDTAFALACGAMILFVAMPAKSDKISLAKVLEFAPFRFVGLVSYSFYLWHLPTLWTLKRLGWIAPATTWGYALNVLLVGGVTLGLSTLTYFFVEKPPLKLKRRTDNGSLEVPTTRDTGIRHESPRPSA